MIARDLQEGQRFYFPVGPVALRVYTALKVNTVEGETTTTFGAKDKVATTTIVCASAVLTVAGTTPVEVA